MLANLQGEVQSADREDFFAVNAAKGGKSVGDCFGNGCGGQPFFEDGCELRLHAGKGEAHQVLGGGVGDGRGGFDKIGVAINFDGDRGANGKGFGNFHAAAVQAQVGDLRGAAGILVIVNNFSGSDEGNSRSAAAFNGHGHGPFRGNG